MRMLPEARRSRAILSDDAFRDIITRNDPKVRLLKLEGLAAGDMSQPEKAHCASSCIGPAIRCMIDLTHGFRVPVCSSI
jgi:hypothetical protein